MDPPDRPTKHNGQPVILLSAFDGIGCAKLALDQAMARTDCFDAELVALQREVDPRQVTKVEAVFEFGRALSPLPSQWTESRP